MKAGEADEKLQTRFIPNGGISVVFNFSGTVSVRDSKTTYVLPSYFLVAPSLAPLIVCTEPPLDTVVVACRASVITRLFAIDLSRPRKKPFFTTVSPIPGALWEQMRQENNRSLRQQSIESFLAGWISKPYQPDGIDAVYDRIIGSGGSVPVNELIRDSGYNPRSFRRNFLSRVGLNAKALSRIVRVNHLWDCHLEGRHNDFQALVAEGNYHDQSHLIRDFKKIIGEAPSFFFKADKKDIAFISGKEMGKNGRYPGKEKIE